jgi:adenosylcobinamide hydrolase
MRMHLATGNTSIQATRDSLIIKFQHPLRVLSSTVLNGGLRRANSILIQHVSRGFTSEDPQADLLKAVARSHLDANMTVGFMTAANPEHFGHSTCESRNIRVTVIATAGASNSAKAGERIKRSKNKGGTVNIIVLTNAKMTDACLVNALQTATEAKTVVFRELDVRSANSGDGATGTSTDALMIGTSDEGPICYYAGTATELGRSIATAVGEAVRAAIAKQDKLYPTRHLLDRLEERGIRIEDLEEAFLVNYIHHKSMGTRDQTRKIFRQLLREFSSDHNVAALVLAALRLEDDGRSGLIPGLPRNEFIKDRVDLLADEIIGMAISTYIAGSKGLFEYVRFDRRKPGIIRKLGPFLDDAIGALVAGVSSNVYSRLLRPR